MAGSRDDGGSTENAVRVADIAKRKAKKEGGKEVCSCACCLKKKT